MNRGQSRNIRVVPGRAKVPVARPRVPTERSAAKLTEEQKEVVADPGNLELCRARAARFARRNRYLTAEEFFEAAVDGLIDAAKGYEEGRGVPFEVYASPRIVGACLDMMRREGVVKFSRVGKKKGFDFRTVSSDRGPREAESPDASHPDAGPSDELRRRLEADDLDRYLVGLGAVEKFVLRKYYGHEAWDQKEIGGHLGLTPSRVSQILGGALEKLWRRSHFRRFRHLYEHLRLDESA